MGQRGERRSPHCALGRRSPVFTPGAQLAASAADAAPIHPSSAAGSAAGAGNSIQTSAPPPPPESPLPSEFRKCPRRRREVPSRCGGGGGAGRGRPAWGPRAARGPIPLPARVSAERRSGGAPSPAAAGMGGKRSGGGRGRAPDGSEHPHRSAKKKN